MKSFALGLSALGLIVSGLFASASAYPVQTKVEKVVVVKKYSHGRPVVIEKKVVVKKIPSTRHKEVRKVIYHRKPHHHVRFDDHRPYHKL